MPKNIPKECGICGGQYRFVEMDEQDGKKFRRYECDICKYPYYEKAQRPPKKQQ